MAALAKHADIPSDAVLQISHSLLQYMRKVRSPVSVPLLLAYMSVVTRHADVATKEEQLFQIYDEICTLTDVFDATSSFIIIEALSLTSKWRECREYIEWYKLTAEGGSHVYAPYLAAAIRMGDIDLSFDILKEIGDRGLAASDGIFLPYLEER